MGVVLLVTSPPAGAQGTPLGFFVTSVGKGDGANLGGLDGADAHCQALAAAVGAGSRTWRAYLSARVSGAQPAVHARDRIGAGPWHNAKGVLMARDVDEIHSSAPTFGKEHSLTETGAEVDGELHDILTGSNADGTLATGSGDTTCSNWTSNAPAGSAMVGHHDLLSGGTTPKSWNAAHPSKGCSQQNLSDTGGAGFFYCFAAK